MLNKKRRLNSNFSFENDSDSYNVNNNNNNNMQIVRSNKPLWVPSLSLLFKSSPSFSLFDLEKFEEDEEKKNFLEKNEKKNNEKNETEKNVENKNSEKKEECEKDENLSSVVSGTLCKIFFSYVCYMPNDEVLKILIFFFFEFFGVLGDFFSYFGAKKTFECYFKEEKEKFDSYKKIKKIKNLKEKKKKKKKNIFVNDFGEDLINIGIEDLIGDIEKNEEKSNNRDNINGDNNNINNNNNVDNNIDNNNSINTSNIDNIDNIDNNTTDNINIDNYINTNINTTDNNLNNTNLNDNTFSSALSLSFSSSSSEAEIFKKEHDAEYVETLRYFAALTENMSNEEYIYINSCRQSSFFSRGKQKFFSFLKKNLKEKFTKEIQNNIDIICFLLKSELKGAILGAIRKAGGGKLVKLSSPLSAKEIELFLNQKIQRLKTILSDFSPSKKKKKKLFPKKKLPDNKYIKIKEDPLTSSISITIKKILLLHSDSERAFFSSQKNSSESRVLNAVFLLRCKLDEIRDEKSGKRKGLRRKNVCKEFQGDTIRKEDIFNYLNVGNFYEYFLLKDHIFKFDAFSLSSLLTSVSAVSKKFIWAKFTEWLTMDEKKKEEIKKEYEEMCRMCKK